MKTIELDGVKYKLTPIEEVIEEIPTDNTTSYLECITDCETFKFTILLKENGEIWKGTQAITYQKNKTEEDYWDIESIIEGWLNYEEEPSNRLEEDLSTNEIKLLNSLRKKVNELGWMK